MCVSAFYNHCKSHSILFATNVIAYVLFLFNFINERMAYIILYYTKFSCSQMQSRFRINYVIILLSRTMLNKFSPNSQDVKPLFRSIYVYIINGQYIYIYGLICKVENAPENIV